MKTYFFKYQGAGNDFILIDDRHDQYSEMDSALISNLCDRRFGIGSDGLILIKKSKVADLWIDFMNPDGSRSFCGNGSRCGLLFAKKLGMIQGESCTFEAVDGVHTGILIAGGARISMHQVSAIEAHEDGNFVYTGSPHLILPVTDLNTMDIKGLGAAIRYSPSYADEGVNVNFVKDLGPDSLGIRTYERGVEDETLACGTGVTAAALVHARLHGLENGTIQVKALGGDLKVSFVKDREGFKDIYLEGPAEEVFCGEIAL
ncbi:MAG: diaminopimelate epimerase [Bacteroidetes bacterium]|jgi:diaminopimelate epimerase|nr:diaminopimelate epimerase [Bacteroidota bacterium]